MRCGHSTHWFWWNDNLYSWDIHTRLRMPPFQNWEVQWIHLLFMLPYVYHKPQDILQGYYELTLHAHIKCFKNAIFIETTEIQFFQIVVNVSKLLEAPKKLLNKNIFTSFKTTLAFTNSQTHLTCKFNIVCKRIISSST